MIEPSPRLIHFTPLRYPGGKAKLAAYVKAVLDENELLDGEYCEPYAGGAGVAFELLLHEYVSRVHINDISRPLLALWRSVLNDTDRLTRRIGSAKLSVAAWDRHKRIFNDADSYDDLDLGFATLYLNRTNRSGILRGGIIGGRAQKSEWGIDARYNAKELIQRVEALASVRDRIKVYNEDAAKFIARIAPKLPRKTLFYLDPPYYIKGKDLYPDYYTAEDHDTIGKLIARVRPQSWIVSYDDVPAIRALYRNFRGIRYELGYSARDVRTGVEVMYFSNNLEIPKPAGPINVVAHLRRARGAQRTR